MRKKWRHIRHEKRMSVLGEWHYPFDYHYQFDWHVRTYYWHLHMQDYLNRYHWERF